MLWPILGLECSKYNNPADFFLDEIDEKEKHEDNPGVNPILLQQYIHHRIANTFIKIL